jgi:hypothetical protein
VGGRQKGTLNKENRDIREMILTALTSVGGAKYLAECARKQPVAFLGLVGKVLPLQIAGTNGNGEATTLTFEWAAATPLIEGSAKDVEPISNVLDNASDKEAAD